MNTGGGQRDIASRFGVDEASVHRWVFLGTLTAIEPGPKAAHGGTWRRDARMHRVCPAAAGVSRKKTTRLLGNRSRQRIAGKQCRRHRQSHVPQNRKYGAPHRSDRRNPALFPSLPPRLQTYRAQLRRYQESRQFNHASFLDDMILAYL